MSTIRKVNRRLEKLGRTQRLCRDPSAGYYYVSDVAVTSGLYVYSLADCDLEMALDHVAEVLTAEDGRPFEWAPSNSVTLTPADLKLIRETATKLARDNGGRGRRFHLEIGERYNLDAGTDRTSINILAVDKNPAWDDSDLYETRPFDWLKKPVELVDGRGVLDFYIYEHDRAAGHGDLVINMQADIDALGLVKLYEGDRADLWSR